MQGLLSQKDVGPASAAANREIPNTNAPLRENSGRFRRARRLLWRVEKRGVFRSAASIIWPLQMTILLKRAEGGLMKPLLQQQGNRLDRRRLVTEKLEELHLFEHRADIEPREARFFVIF